MTSQGSAYGRYRRSLDARNATAALAAAAELPRVAMIDALELCRLLAAVGDGRYERAAARWLRRLLENGAELDEVLLAAGALSQLRAEPESGVAWDTLCRLCEPGT